MKLQTVGSDSTKHFNTNKIVTHINKSDQQEVGRELKISLILKMHLI